MILHGVRRRQQSEHPHDLASDRLPAVPVEIRIVLLGSVFPSLCVIIVAAVQPGDVGPFASCSLFGAAASSTEHVTTRCAI